MRELEQLLDVLDSPLANLALTGRPVRFSELGQAEREDYLKRWAASPLPLKRKAFQVMKRLVLLYAYGTDDSPYWSLLGYRRPPEEPPATPALLRRRFARAGEVIEADACVVGSGAGGGVAAATLAAAGKRVVVLDRARLRAEPEFDERELDGYAALFLDRAIAATEDRAISLLAGSAVGGGTVVNWTTSLRLPAGIAAEWRAAGIDDLDDHYAAVEERLDIGTDESGRNGANAALERGLRALGLRCETIPRNVRGCDGCRQCMVGCRRGAKLSTLRTYLADASRDGAELIDGCEARRIEVRDGAVAGVMARTSTGELTVRAPLVALSGGAILSPALLLRSGIAGDRAGRGLLIHPVPLVLGVYDEEIRFWEGVPQSVMSDAFAELEESCGFRIEVPPGLPGIAAAVFPWWGSAAHRALAAQATRIAPFFALVRDRDGGSVSIDAAGNALVSYRPGALERRLLVRAMREMARIHLAAGARRVLTLHYPPLELARDDDFERFAGELERRGIAPNAVSLFSAHQMSTCRIGTSPRDSVADPDGQVWGVRGLYVTDASAFPSASGVNPMLTVMALARRTAQRML